MTEEEKRAYDAEWDKHVKLKRWYVVDKDDCRLGIVTSEAEPGEGSWIEVLRNNSNSGDDYVGLLESNFRYATESDFEYFRVKLPPDFPESGVKQ